MATATTKMEVSFDQGTRRLLVRVADALEESNKISKRSSSKNDHMLQDLINEWGALGVVRAIIEHHPGLTPEVVFPAPQTKLPTEEETP